ncbi:MAG: hypothetical protein WKG03_15570 [Telluria sp.]
MKKEAGPALLENNSVRKQHILSLPIEEAKIKRDQLVKDGFCVVPAVLHGAFLEELQGWTDNLMDTHPVPDKLKYQGSDFHVTSERRFQERGLLHPNALHDEIIDRLIDWPEQN